MCATHVNNKPAMSARVTMTLPLLVLAAATESMSGDSGSGETPEDIIIDIYTILAIVFLSCLGLLLLVRVALYFVTCAVAIEETEASSRPVIRVEGVQTCAAPTDERV